MSRYGDVAFEGAKFDISLPPMVDNTYDSSKFDYSRYNKLGSFGFDRSCFNRATYNFRTTTGFDFSQYSSQRYGFGYSRLDKDTYEQPQSDVSNGYDGAIYGGTATPVGHDYSSFDSARYNQSNSLTPGSLFDSNPYISRSCFNETITYGKHSLQIAEELISGQLHILSASLEQTKIQKHAMSNEEFMSNRLHILSCSKEIMMLRRHIMICLSPEVDLD